MIAWARRLVLAPEITTALEFAELFAKDMVFHWKEWVLRVP